MLALISLFFPKRSRFFNPMPPTIPLHTMCQNILPRLPRFVNPICPPVHSPSPHNILYPKPTKIHRFHPILPELLLPPHPANLIPEWSMHYISSPHFPHKYDTGRPQNSPSCSLQSCGKYPHILNNKRCFIMCTHCCKPSFYISLCCGGLHSAPLLNCYVKYIPLYRQSNFLLFYFALK